jgi:hypothetical protein
MGFRGLWSGMLIFLLQAASCIVGLVLMNYM